MPQHQAGRPVPSASLIRFAARNKDSAFSLEDPEEVDDEASLLE